MEQFAGLARKSQRDGCDFPGSTMSREKLDAALSVGFRFYESQIPRVGRLDFQSKPASSKRLRLRRQDCDVIPGFGIAENQFKFSAIDSRDGNRIRAEVGNFDCENTAGIWFGNS